MYEEAKDEETSEVRRPLPSLKQGDAVELKNVTKEQQFTQPPARYTEATLIRAMEEKGIGRPVDVCADDFDHPQPQLCRQGGALSAPDESRASS